jgi:hypothetical protein
MDGEMVTRNGTGRNENGRFIEERSESSSLSNSILDPSMEW